MTETRTIKVKYLNQPKEGKTYGSVKTPENKTYLAKPEILDEMEVGGSYSCVVNSKDFGDGYVWFINEVGASTQAPKDNAPAAEDATSKNIFVTGIVGRAMGSGKFEPEDILKLTAAALGAFDLLSGKTKTERTPDPYQDEVPF